MFSATVLICSMSACQTIEDERGPYKTQEKCYERLIETAQNTELMTSMVMLFHIEHKTLSPVTVNFKCEYNEQA